MANNKLAEIEREMKDLLWGLIVDDKNIKEKEKYFEDLLFFFFNHSHTLFWHNCKYIIHIYIKRKMLEIKLQS